MNYDCRSFLKLVLFACCLVCVAPAAYAQDNPFEDDPFKGNPFDSNPFEKGDEPAADGESESAKPEGVAIKDTSDIKVEKIDPTVVAITARDPQTPLELMKAIDQLIDLSREDLAIDYVNRLAALDLNDQQLYELYEQSGADKVFRLSVSYEMGPETVELAKKVIVASERFVTEKTRIDALAETVTTSEDKYERSVALAQLRSLGDVGAAVLIEKLADENYQANWGRIREAVGMFGRSAEGPLLAANRSNSLKLQVEANHLLGNIRSTDAIETLMVPVLSNVSPEIQKKVAGRSMKNLTGRILGQLECEERLYRSAREYLMDEVVIDRDANDMVKWWRWNAETEKLVPMTFTARTVARIRAFARAKDLVELNPQNDDYQRLFWVARMESAKLTSGLERPMPQVVVDTLKGSIEPEMALAVLDQSLEMGRVPAAVAACEVLGSMGHERFLNSSGETASPLIRALEFGSVRLAHAAANAIFQIDRRDAFSGSSTYLATMVKMARSDGSRAALVGHVNISNAQQIAALTFKSGYHGSPATNPRDFLSQASANPDLQLMVITDKMGNPGFSELVQALRVNPSTKLIPILLMVDPENMYAAERLRDRFDNLLVTTMIEDELMIARQIENLERSLAYRDASQIERTEYALISLRQLSHYAFNSIDYPFYDLVRFEEDFNAALGVPSSAAYACRLLGHVGTRDAQLNLVRTASNIQMPDSLRQIAANSFATSVRTGGLLLTRQEILDQYSLYNSSEAQPAKTQQILGSLLDAIERRSPTSAN